VNQIKKIALFIVVWQLLLVTFNANEVNVVKTKKQHTDSFYDASKMYSSAFIQPHSNLTFISNNKVNDYTSIGKYLDYFPNLIPRFRTLNQSKYYANQDINRCEMVSLLLFPFHYFW
jgi:hypothetical protein